MRIENCKSFKFYFKGYLKESSNILERKIAKTLPGLYRNPKMKTQTFAQSYRTILMLLTT